MVLYFIWLHFISYWIPFNYIVWYCMSFYCIWFHCIVLHVISLNCMLLHSFVLYSISLHGIACHFIVLYGIAWYCIVFVFFARYRTVMYRCYSAPANYRVVHLVIFILVKGTPWGWLGERQFQRCSIHDQHSRPWTGSLCQETFLQHTHWDIKMLHIGIFKFLGKAE